MNKKILNSKKFQSFVRFMGIFTAALLAYTTSSRIIYLFQNHFVLEESINKADFFLGVAVNLLVLIIGVIIAIKPSTYALIGIGSFIYTILIATESPLYYMNIPMLFLTIAILLCTNFYQKHKKIVIGIIAAICLYEVFIPLIFDFDTFLESLVQKIGFSFTIALAVFFFNQFFKGKEIEE